MALMHSRSLDALDRAIPNSLAWFVRDVEALYAVHAEVRTLASAVADRLAGLVRDRHWLSEADRQPWEDRYRQHLLYVAPDRRFSIVSLVWKTGQKTPIHDHVSWCVVGMYQGEERETRYRLYLDGDERFLVETACEVAVPGQTMALVPPDEDIHQVACVGNQSAISIHVYGADIATLGTSIHRRFDDLAIRADAGDAAPARWREL